MTVNHPHLVAPDVHAAVGFLVSAESRVHAAHARLSDERRGACALRREHACSFYVNAAGELLVELGA